MKRSSLGLLLLSVSALPLTMCNDYDNELMPAGMVSSSDPTADRLYAAACAFAAAGKTNAAISKLKEIVTDHALSPIAPQARLMLGDMYCRDEDYRQAFKEYDKVIAHYHSSPCYEQALNRELELAMKAVKGEMKGQMLWGLWEVGMESSVVEEWLQNIVKNAPYNDMAATALSMLARYQLEVCRDPERARASYAQLAERYPDSSLAPAAQLMTAQLWSQQHTRGNNALVNLQKAQEAYEEFLLRYPNDRRAGEARRRVAEMRALLVDQELEVGRYYLERARSYSAAMQCFRSVIAQKSVNPTAAKEAAELYRKAAALAEKGKATH
ncbi:MAG TPA: outer membrane protein assembly factor BamD [Candidatus Akkermansia intestinigallinarum]|uniref:Outer membrane protein assembly factor BamD n=1 Tax=Candidatus Akkermansia intestinigallinarum TaxID=2838431 RepID=A0A9D2AIQ9_9BACT|nr:outer membrane protein assembly factor BamD [Candidatus Akkermansia intestinigallinarum]